MKKRIEHKDTHRDKDARLHCGDELVTGEVVSRDHEGRVIALISYVEGVPSGPHVRWYPDGTKKKEGQTRRGLAVGAWRKWHPNGQLAEHTVFDDRGMPVRRQAWDREGNLTEDE
ncbi:hypothetical protein AB0B21_22720 [Streptomyces rimosus]|uniref:toxin-antitoxin system YwqK family antitoxin n=1 Tax=Streptomyces rimosus TaxID=1927 RepID=UPI00067ACEAE|nr:hypothetical protein [Streptomyces rimosus]